MKRKIGIFPGTFDPIHEGHIAFAEAAAINENLDAVYFLPEKKPRNKTHVTDQSARIELIDACINGRDNMYTLQLSEDCFSVKVTLPSLLKYFHNAELFLLVGSDVFMNLHAWDAVETLLGSISVIVGFRNKFSSEDFRKIEEQLPITSKKPSSISKIETEYKNMSSSQIRNNKIK